MPGKTKGVKKSPNKKKKTPEKSAEKSPKKSPNKKKVSPGNSPKKGNKGAKKGRGRSKSPKNKGKRGRSKSQEEPVQAQPQNGAQEAKVLPEPPPGVVPLFLTTQTQQIFQILADVNVTRESPNVLLDKNALLEDINQRKAISDFFPINEVIVAYPSDEFLVVYDADFLYGENFFACATEEAKTNVLFPPDEEEEEEDPFALPDIPYIPPEPKPWQNLGSDMEVVDETVFECRPKVKLTIMKSRRHFAEKCNFSNRDADAGKDTYQECLPNYERRNVVCQKELDKGTQAVPAEEVKSIQTEYRKPLRQWSQYVARELSEEDKGDVMESDVIDQFVKDVTPVMEAALQQNEIIDVFRNDWVKLNPSRSMMTAQQDSYLKEYQSFQDLHYSKDKQIICDDWHTTIPGLVGVSCVEQMSFDVRLRNMSRIMIVPSLVLLWNYQDPIHPRLLLEAPDDCFIFRFNPVNPNLVAGGCMSGRIVLWDLTQYYGKLAMTESTIQIKKLAFLSNLVEDTEGKIPVVQPVATTHTDFGHPSCVTDLQWLLPPYIIDKQGKVIEDTTKSDEECHQIMSCAGDDYFFVWDIFVQNTRRAHLGVIPDVGSTEIGHWQLLDHNWRPVVRINLPNRSDGTPYSLNQFRVRCIAKELKDDEGEEAEEPEETEQKEQVAQEAPEGAAKSPLSLYAGTQAGEILFFDLRVKRDSDTNKTIVCELEEQQIHAEPIRSICISPFFDDLVLTVGGFRFAVWKVGIKHKPLMVSAQAPSRRTSGVWSLTRPSVFFIGRQQGSIEVWDMLDRAQEALLTQSLSGVEVTTLSLRKLGRRQVLSVSDNSGNLHLLEVPLILSQMEGDEMKMLENLFARETLRQETEAKNKEEERKNAEEEDKEPASAPENVTSLPPVPPQRGVQTPEDLAQMAEVEYESKSVYESYLLFEKKMLDKLEGKETSDIDITALQSAEK
ncbi:dynein intermediate chain 3, axonemal-like [Pollicipes pollicipes]|uniref:dynein intermediate chain 3, axonemal-like n=1 Tax=Pollicipes pollicipes TaxID=41117 RepID=UPI001885373C|nr:dynein intermediate chain 3, axonemal-like [Pollicipes pollicipes]XP_037070688.1 dynein intermediate chain 3, axonemal-like [Pollicipes pollicipes]